jgi:hypothetical protein
VAWIKSINESRKSSPFSWIIFIAGLVSLALGFIPYKVSEYFHELGFALLIAWALSLTVDSYFKRGLLRDAFEAVFGYVLPDYFREELNRISKEVFIAQETRIEFEICRIPNTDLVETTWTWNRKLKNISNKKQEFKLFLGVDDFGFKDHSAKVHNCELQMDSGERVVWTPHEPKMVCINPEQKFEVYQKCSEVHRSNGVSFFVVFQPSVDPEITIIHPDDIECGHPQFVHPNNTIQTVQLNRYRLKGTFMPYQPVIVRWTPKDLSLNN